MTSDDLPSDGAALTFAYMPRAQEEGALEDGGDEAHVQIFRADASKNAASAAELFASIAANHPRISESDTFKLLQAARRSHGFAKGADKRAQITKWRLVALSILGMAVGTDTCIHAIMEAEADLIAQIVELVMRYHAIMQDSQEQHAQEGNEPQSTEVAETSRLARLFWPALGALESLLCFSVDNNDVSITQDILQSLGLKQANVQGALSSMLRSALFEVRKAYRCTELSIPSSISAVSDDVNLSVGLVFAGAAKGDAADRAQEGNKPCTLRLGWSVGVLSLTVGVVQTLKGAKAIVDCGILGTLFVALRAELAQCAHQYFIGCQDAGAMPALRLQSCAIILTIIRDLLSYDNNNAHAQLGSIDGVDTLCSLLSCIVNSAVDVSTASRSNDNSESDMSSASSSPQVQSETAKAKRGRRAKTKKARAKRRSKKKDEPNEAPRVHASAALPMYAAIIRGILHIAGELVQGSRGRAKLVIDKLREEPSELVQSLRTIIANGDAFGHELLTTVLDVVCCSLHHDARNIPRVIHESGLADDIIRAMARCRQKTVMPLLLCAFVRVSGAMCLSKDGQRALEEANAIPLLLEGWLDPAKYLTDGTAAECGYHAAMRAMEDAGSPCTIMGGHLDELIRHTPEFRDSCINACIGAAKKIRDAFEAFKATSTLRGSGSAGLREQRDMIVLLRLLMGALEIIRELFRSKSNIKKQAKDIPKLLFCLHELSVPYGQWIEPCIRAKWAVRHDRSRVDLGEGDVLIDTSAPIYGHSSEKYLMRVYNGAAEVTGSVMHRYGYSFPKTLVLECISMVETRLAKLSGMINFDKEGTIETAGHY